MATELIPLGVVHAMVQNQIYACPTRAWRGFTDTVAATLEASDEVTFATAIALTISAAGEFLTSAPFIRCTSGAINVRLQTL